MTYYARVVLDDCRGALEDLSEEGLHGDRWRRRWVAAVSLLRSVMHVLAKVDSETSTEMQVSIDEAWKELRRTRPEPAIFWRFIDEERNLTLKEGSFGAGQVYHQRYDEEGNPIVFYSYPFHAEPFQGMDQREVVGRAIEWLEGYLDQIDEAVYTAVPIGTVVEEAQGIGMLLSRKGGEIASVEYDIRVIQAEYGWKRASGRIDVLMQTKSVDRFEKYILSLEDGREIDLGIIDPVSDHSYTVILRGPFRERQP